MKMVALAGMHIGKIENQREMGGAKNCQMKIPNKKKQKKRQYKYKQKYNFDNTNTKKIKQIWTTTSPSIKITKQNRDPATLTCMCILKWVSGHGLRVWCFSGARPAPSSWLGPGPCGLVVKGAGGSRPE